MSEGHSEENDKRLRTYCMDGLWCIIGYVLDFIVVGNGIQFVFILFTIISIYLSGLDSLKGRNM